MPTYPIPLQAITNINSMSRRILRKGQTPSSTHTELYDRITKMEHEVLERIRELKAAPRPAACQHLMQ